MILQKVFQKWLLRLVSATGVYDNIINSIINFFINTWKSIGALGLGILNTFPKLGSVVYQLISKIFVDFLVVFTKLN